MARVDIGDAGPPVSGWQLKIVGGVLLWIGVGAVGLFSWMLYKARLDHLGVYVFLAAFAIISLFCLSVGWRLFFNRPNRYGSILDPISWRIVGTMFGLIAWFFTELIMARLDARAEVLAMFALWLALSCAVCYWCFRRARLLSTHGSSGKGAL